MAAGQLEHLVPQTLLAEAVKHLLRVNRQKRRIVPGPDQKRWKAPPREPIEVTRGADYGPVPPKFVLAHVTFKALPDVLRGQAGPDHVREEHRNVIEDPGAHPRIVRGRNECYA